MAPREQFESELTKVKKNIIELANGTRSLLIDAVDALYNQDINKANQVIQDDIRLDKLDYKINEETILLIAKQQPVATDLRRLIVTIRISSDLERMADNAKNIAKATIHLGTNDGIDIHPFLNEMKEKAIEMIDHAIMAFNNEDIHLARKLSDMDDVVDNLYGKVINEMLEESATNHLEKQYIIQMALSVRYIERIADHATNIGESIIYLVKGVVYDLN